MAWSHVMFAVASPGGSEPSAIDKAMHSASALNAELELFHCIFDVEVARPGRFATRDVEEDIHEFIEQRQRQLERAVEPLRGHGVRMRSSVRWGETITMNSRMR